MEDEQNTIYRVGNAGAEVDTTPHVIQLSSRCVGAITCAGSRRQFKSQSQFLTRHANESVQNNDLSDVEVPNRNKTEG
jgi:hypothetical protein